MEDERISLKIIAGKISNLLFLIICIVMLFGVSMILFDKGAVMIAEDIVSVDPH